MFKIGDRAVVKLTDNNSLYIPYLNRPGTVVYSWNEGDYSFVKLRLDDTGETTRKMFRRRVERLPNGYIVDDRLFDDVNEAIEYAQELAAKTNKVIHVQSR